MERDTRKELKSDFVWRLSETPLGRNPGNAPGLTIRRDPVVRCPAFCRNRTGRRHSGMTNFRYCNQNRNFGSTRQRKACCQAIVFNSSLHALLTIVRMAIGFAILLYFTLRLVAATPPVGVAPTVVPAGFAIEGNLLAN